MQDDSGDLARRRLDSYRQESAYAPPDDVTRVIKSQIVPVKLAPLSRGVRLLFGLDKSLAARQRAKRSRCQYV